MDSEVAAATSEPEVLVLRDPAAVAHVVATRFRIEAKRAVEARDQFHVALAGGKTPRLTYSILNSMTGIPWSKLELFIGDERAVPLNHERSNYRMVRRRLLEDIDDLVGRVHHLSTFERSLEDIAATYQRLLEEVLGAAAVFDLILVGVRPDGSTMGLLPGRAESRDLERLVVAVQGGDAGPDRISLSPEVLRRARKVWVIAVGSEKGEIVRKLQSGAADLSTCPAAWLSTVPGEVTWFLDQAAARHLDPKESE